MEEKAYTGTKRDPTGKRQPTEKDCRKQGPACRSPFCTKSSYRRCQERKEEDRADIFKEFWSTMDWGQRKRYASSLVDHVPPKYSKRTAKTKRTGTFIYHLRVRGDKLQVCKTMFMNTLGIGEWCVRDWVLKSVRVHGMHTSPSSRKQHRNTGADKREKVMTAREFLESLAKLPSHYCRKGSQKLYLETVITSRTHLCKVFQEYCDSKGKLRMSRQVLLKEMKMQNIAIYKPKKKKKKKKINAMCVLGTVS